MDSMKVLITEDDFAIQALMRRQVEKWGYSVQIASNGSEALDIVYSDNPPQIILMDWMMPKLNGVEACSKIKQDTSLPMIYIIMLTSRTGHQDIVEGLNAGADDYIGKPVDSEELRSRLRVAKRTVKNERQLRKYAEEMEVLAMERAQQLIHADRLVTIGTMSAGIVHEINNPLGAITGTAQVLEKYWDIIIPIISCEKERNPDPKLSLILEDMPQTLGSIKDNGKRISEIIANLKRFYKNNTATDMYECGINDCIESSLQVCHPKLKNRVVVNKELSDGLPQVFANPQQIEQVLVNLIVNAAEAIENSGAPSGTVKIVSRLEGKMVVVEIDNDGPAIPDDVLKRIWNSFYTTKKEGTGLGLSISREIILKHQGDMFVENLTEGVGVRFTVKIPQAARG